MREDDDRDTDDDYDDSTARYSMIPWGGGWWGGGWGWPRRYGEDEKPEDATYRGGTYEEEDDSWLDEALISLLLIGGIILFFFPEPITSTIGIILVLVGALAWLVDALT